MNNNYESHAISRRSFLKASGVVGAAGILAACGGNSGSSSTAASSGATSAPNTTGATPLKEFIPHHAVHLGAQSYDNVTKDTVIHIQAPFPQDLSGINS